MAQVFLTSAAEALEQANKVRATKFHALATESAFVIEDLNSRIATAVEEGQLFIKLTKEEIETVPNVKPEVFLAFLEDRGFTILSLSRSEFAAYFKNPIKEEA